MKHCAKECCIIGSIISVSGLLTGLINNTNILVIYLSLVVVFFLLGLILGLNIQPGKKIPKDIKLQDTTDPLNKSRQSYVSVPESREKADKLQYTANSSHKHSRHRHHKHSSVHIQ